MLPHTNPSEGSPSYPKDNNNSSSEKKSKSSRRQKSSFKSKKYELSSKYATSEEDAKLRKDYSLLRRMIRGALRHRTAPNPDEEEVPNSMVLDLCRKHPEWALSKYETERPGVTLSPLKFLIHNRARLEILQGFCHSFPQAAQENDTTTSGDNTTDDTRISGDASRLLGYPLHLACTIRQEEGQFIALLAQQYPPAVSCPNQNGLLPLHLLLEYRGLAPSLEAVQTLVELNPETILQTPAAAATAPPRRGHLPTAAIQAPLLTVLSASHCSNEIKECLWQHVPLHLTSLQLDATVVPEVTLPLAKAICHVLPQLTSLEWTPHQWAPPAWIYFVQKCRRLQPASDGTTTRTLKRLVLTPPSSVATTTTANTNHAAIPFPSRLAAFNNNNNAAAANATSAPALNSTHMHRALVNLLQHVVTLEHLEIRGTAPPSSATAGFRPAGGFTTLTQALGGRGNNDGNFFQQQQQNNNNQAFGFGFNNPQNNGNNNNPTWQLLANQGMPQRPNNNNPGFGMPVMAPNNHNNQQPQACPDITEPMVHLLTNGRLQYLKISGYSVDLNTLLRTLVHNTTLQQLILLDPMPPVVVPDDYPGHNEQQQQQAQLTLGSVLEHHNYTLQKADVRIALPPRHALGGYTNANELVRQAILQEYQKVKYYTLLNQFGRATARDQTTSLQTMIQILGKAQVQPQEGGQQQQQRVAWQTRVHNRDLVVLGVLFGLLRESPGSWSQPEQHEEEGKEAMDMTIEPSREATLIDANQKRKRKDPPLLFVSPGKERKLAAKTQNDDEQQTEE